jgi:hydrogenase maturation protein HypF
MIQRAHIAIRGAVQGVGFRPFVYRLATELRLKGWVANSAQGVFVEVEGEKSRLDDFLIRLGKEKPSRSSIQSLECSLLDPAGFGRFEIRESRSSGRITALVLPDIATCADCQREIFDSTDRRHLYPFTNCTNCGPRFTIIESLPYDRANTTMKKFAMCEECKEEYENPLDRRFHAQPNACPKCGPHLELWDERGKLLSARQRAVLEAAEALRAGRIVAVKGLGGFHLVVDTRDDRAVLRLREKKRREEKPFALLYSSLQAIKGDCEVSSLEERLLLSPESPIVLLRRKGALNGIAPSVAPRNPNLGVMLPYTPLHHILMRELGFPVVATSGNLSDEPICTDEVEALERLRGIADLFLVHDRPIARPVDDSVVRIVMGRELVLRRARGYAPLPVCPKEEAPPLLAVGGHLKNTIAMTAGRNVFISQHIGDLETEKAFEAFQKIIRSFQTLYGVRPDQVVCDMHPDYLSTSYAKGQGENFVAVQHHHAHVASCMAENELEGQVLGVAWDGSGYGTDGTLWGGEFLLTDGPTFKRAASFRKFPLPGSSRAIKEPRRAALGLLYELFGEGVFEQENLPPLNSFTASEKNLLRQMLKKGVGAPLTSSVGRLFDAVASIVGLRQCVYFEGQAAMELEFAIRDEKSDESYPFGLTDHGGLILVDWEPMVLAVLDDIKRTVPVSIVSAKFHNTLAKVIVDIARWVGEERVVLTGGCFQNRYLTERAIKRLQADGARPYWHQRVPPNDGGIALGQIFAVAQAMRRNALAANSKGLVREAELGGLSCA